MSNAQLHLLVNHLPVVLPIVGTVLLAAGLLVRSAPVREAALWTLLMAGLFSVPAYYSGGWAETEMKNFPGVTRATMHEHEEAAEVAWIAGMVLGAAGLALLVLLRRGKRIAGYVWALVILVGIATSVLMARAAHLGGMIRHEEIRSNYLSPKLD